MNKNYESQQVRNEMYVQLNKLMGEAQDCINKNGPGARQYYNFPTHHYLAKEGWELLFSLEKEFWPKKFQDLIDNYEPGMFWPQYTSYCYLMDVICPPEIPHSLLHFGYAIFEDELIRCTFFVIQSMVTYQDMPQGMVIDPLAERSGKVPSFYIGSPVLDKEQITDWMRTKKNPLETYVQNKNEKEHRERIYNSYMQSYFTQMNYEPEWFPHQLIEFAKKEELYVPPNQKSSM